MGAGGTGQDHPAVGGEGMGVCVINGSVGDRWKCGGSDLPAIHFLISISVCDQKCRMYL